MPNLMDTLELDFRWLGAIAGLGTLGFAIWNMLIAQRRPTGHQTGVAHKVLRSRYLVVATLLFIILGWVLWKPIPIELPLLLRLLCLVLGSVILFSSLGVYIWGLRTLGESFNASTGFGVRLHQAHQLITTGPYVYVRHPMYAAVILAGWGGLLLFRTWMMLFFAVTMFGLLYRARGEEKALVQVFGGDWEDYKRRVPGWIPNFKAGLRKVK